MSSATAVLAALALLASACGSPPHSPSPPPPDGPAPETPGDPGPDPGAEPPSGPPPTPPMQACTKEAKVCPDGSAVGRSGPDCAFAPCPGEAGGSPPPGEPPRGGSCKDLCGNGTCEEIVCMAVGCPCAETRASCPQDCR